PPARRRSELSTHVGHLIMHEIVRSNRKRHPDGRLRNRWQRLLLPPLIDDLRRQFGRFTRYQTFEETKNALAAERALALDDLRLTPAEQVAWVAAVDHLAAEWIEEERTAVENSGDQTPGTARTDERRRQRLARRQLARQ